MKRELRFFKRMLHIFMALNLTLAYPVTLFGANIPGFYGNVGNLVQPAANQLPVVRSIVEGVSSIEQTAKNKLVVTQSEDKAIVSWDSFDIGSDAWVDIDQEGNTGWSILNRIYSASPSQIYGRLTADGTVYLINQNGILFGPGSTINVSSLVASALNISDDDFLGELLSFSADGYFGEYDADMAVVSNCGTIETENGGSVLLIGSSVENSGAISSTNGAIFLVAASDVSVEETISSSKITYDVDATLDAGEAVNYENGTLEAEQGYIGMFGRAVNQNGLVRAVTALNTNGVIELRASESITLGENSITTSPISDADEEALNENWNGGKISLESDGYINLQGSIVAPSGTVTLTAGTRIYLDSGSTIDVSGNWLAMSVEEAVASLQLNSVELADDYNQKDSILQGTTIYFFMAEGSGIGNVENALTTYAKTALEYSTAGGDITLNAGQEVIARSGSTLDFSGGGIVFLEGFADTTVLVSEGDVYRIEEALETLDYDEVIGPENLVTDTSERWGVSEAYSGTYHTGSTASIRNYYGGFIQGDDAGSLTVIAPVVVLNGSSDGSVLTGVYQTETEESEDDSGSQATLGVSKPTAGTLTIGKKVVYEDASDTVLNTIDYVVQEIVVSAESTLLDSAFMVDSALPDELEELTILSDEILNDSGVAELNLYALESISINPDASIELDVGGTLTLTSRHIEHYGTIAIPAGTVSFTLASNLTSVEGSDAYIGLEELGYERIYLASGSAIDVSGETVDLSADGLLAGGSTDPGIIGGGTVSFEVRSIDGEGVIVMDGASIDASGGWRIEEDGDVTGGDAGTISMSGSTLILDGSLSLYSLAHADGGTLDLHAQQVTVTGDAAAASLSADFDAGDALAENLANQLLIGTDQIDATGAANIVLTSVTDLTVEAGVSLTPSTLKLSGPEVDTADSDGNLDNYTASEATIDDGSLVDVTLDELGDTSISLAAGEELAGIYQESAELIDRMDSASVRVESGASITVSPAGSISIEGPDVYIAGEVVAPAGTVSLDANSSLADNSLTLASGALVSAAAYNRVIEGVLEGTSLNLGDEALDGGTVSLSSKTDLIVEAGAMVDVSGSDPTQQLVLQDDGTYRYETVTGLPGEIRISFTDSFQLDGVLLGTSTLASMQGATLSLTKTNTGTALSLSDAQIEAYLAAGFDDLTFASYCELVFEDAVDAAAARKLTLDAAVVSTDENVCLSAPWIVLQNTYTAMIPDNSAASGIGSLTITADWIDINGDVTLSGLGTLTLDAQRDLRLTDLKYTQGGNAEASGRLETRADILINADRVYPTTNSDFTIATSGDVTTTAVVDDPSGNPIYSAGGSLTLEAANITHEGRWYAPMGQLVLNVEDGGRIYLDSGSVLSTAGQAMVYYGTIDEDTLGWEVTDTSGETSDVESAEENSVTIDAGDDGEVILQDGATIDISGGGGMYTYLWQASTSGSTDPLDGCYVIIAGYSDDLPGEAVYLAGNDLIEEGVYTLLDASYAFLDGAIVIEDLGAATTTYGSTSTTETGYALTTGYTTVSGTNFSSSQLHLYSVRSAADVLAEGNFTVEELTAGDAGSLSVSAGTTILNGNLEASALDGYARGTLSLSSANISLGAAVVSLPTGFTASSAIPDEYVGKLILNAASLSESGLEYLTLGNESTDTIVVDAGATLEAANITLTAADSITVETGSRVSASGESGILALNASDGTITVEESATLHAADTIAIDTTTLNLSGKLSVDNSTLSLTSSSITIIGDGSASGTSDGLVIDGDLWEAIYEIDTVILASHSVVSFDSDMDLTAVGTLVIDTDGIVVDDAASVTVTAARIALENTSLDTEVYAETTATSTGTGTIIFAADDMSISLGAMADDNADEDVTNDLAIVGADTVLRVENDLVIDGEGTFSTDGDLTLESAAIVTALAETTDSDGTGSVTTADVTLASAGAITTIANGNSSETDTGYGSSLTLTGQSISHGGIVVSPSGTVILAASGDIALASGSGIDAGGTDTAAGGAVTLQSEAGGIEIMDGATVVVSAGGQGDAGTIALSAAQGTVSIQGTLSGEAAGGTGGSFNLDTRFIDDTTLGFTDIVALLTEGGFDEAIDLRARQGDVTVADADSLSAASIAITADGGSVSVAGILDVSAADGGGALEINAGENIDLLEGSSLLASANDAGDGGEIVLAAEEGVIYFNEGAVMDVRGVGENATGGAVYLRALRTEDSLQVHLAGEITGASAVYAEGVSVTTGVETLRSSGSSSDTSIAYMEDLVAAASAWLANLDFHYTTAGIGDILEVVPGIEIRSNGDLAVTAAIDLADYADDFDYGVLTLRAAGDLTIGRDVTDARTDYEDLNASTAVESWSLNLVAGADLESSDSMAVDDSTDAGSLTVSNSRIVYTENGTIRFASAGDTILGTGGGEEVMAEDLAFTLGSFAGTVSGYTGGDLSVSGAIQTGSGDIQLTVEGDLVLRQSGSRIGSIRTIGEYVPTTVDLVTSSGAVFTYTWAYDDYISWSNGGSITLDVDGDIDGAPKESDAWEGEFSNLLGNFMRSGLGAWYIAKYEGGTKGIVTMAGGDIAITAGGDVMAGVGLFGEGNLELTAGGDLDGRFMISDGSASMNVYGNFGLNAYKQTDDWFIEVLDAQVSLVSQGSVQLATVANPTIADDYFSSVSSFSYLTYTETTSVSLTSIEGDVILTGEVDLYSDDDSTESRILPATVTITAGGDIVLDSSFYLCPAADGNLTLTAGGDISGDYNFIKMSDADPSKVYGYVYVTDAGYDPIGLITDVTEHAESILHADDDTAVTIQAGGDIEEISLFMPKQAEVSAGGDIVDIYYYGQNNDDDDLTTIVAGGDISFSTSDESNTGTGIVVGGPGTVVVAAGGSIDLGTSQGIRLVGNLYNQAFSTTDMLLYIFAGLALDPTGTPGQVSTTNDFFDALREAGEQYSAAQAEGDIDAAAQLLKEIDATIIDAYFANVAVSDGGDINMTNSQIYTSKGAGDIYIVSAGEINVGLTSFGSDDDSNDTGIYTTYGGAINVYVNEDLNVNESRVMTFMGGDITVWSQNGDINAGKGSKTAVSSSSSTVERDADGNEYIVYQPPSVGSGIRALTYDPDGAAGSLVSPDPGDIYLFAPAGEIDAGEAGIVGSNIVLAATEVVNAQNIEVGGTSVGVPDTSASAGSIGAVAGSGTVSEASNVAESQAGLASAKDRFAKYVEELSETLVPKWLAVEVVGFEGDTSDSSMKH